MAASFDKRKFGLVKAARVEKYRGLVFASLSPDVENLADYLAGAKYYIDLFMDLSPEGAVEARAGTHKYGYDGNWKFQMENGVDGYHPNFVHQAFFEIQGKNARPQGDAALHRELPTSRARTSATVTRFSTWRPSVPRDRAGTRTSCAARLRRRAPRRYMESLIRATARSAPRRFLPASNVNLAIFPNLLIIGIQFRITMPISATRTDVHLLPTTLKGVPDEINVARLRAHEAFYGSAGGGAPDDVEMFNRCTDGLRVKGAEWLELSRGIEREQVGADGITIGHITDEVPQRAFYRRWKAVMCGAAQAQQIKPLRVARTS